MSSPVRRAARPTGKVVVGATGAARDKEVEACGLVLRMASAGPGGKEEALFTHLGLAWIKLNILPPRDAKQGEEHSARQMGERLAEAAGNKRGISMLAAGRALWNLSGLAVVDAHAIAAQHVTQLHVLTAAAIIELLCTLEAKLLKV